MTEPVSYMRQTDFFDPEKQKKKIHVYGAGSTGSMITFMLAKLGFNDITVYDFDKVEIHNIPSQIYGPSDNGLLKVEALQAQIEDLTGVKICFVDSKIDKLTNIIPGLDEIHILCFDNLEARKIVYEKLKNFPTIMIDTRIGGEEYNIQVIFCDDKKSCEKYEKSLDIIPTKLKCGSQAIIYSIISLASEVCLLIKKINNEEKHKTKIVRNMNNYIILNGEDKK